MNEQRKTFIFRKEWYDAISQLDKDSRLELYDAIMRKAFNNEQPLLSPMGKLAMSFIEPQIEKDFGKWLDVREKRSNAGKAHKGNQYSLLEQNGTNGTSVPTMEQNGTNGTSVPTMEQNGTNGTVYVDNIYTDNVIYKKKEKTIEEKSSIVKKKVFVKPSVEEVNAYIQEKDYHFDAESFIAYYESKGWLVGKSPMKDWHAACVTWEKSYKGKHPIPTAANIELDKEKWQY